MGQRDAILGDVHAPYSPVIGGQSIAHERQAAVMRIEGLAGAQAFARRLAYETRRREVRLSGPETNQAREVGAKTPQLLDRRFAHCKNIGADESGFMSAGARRRAAVMFCVADVVA